MVLLVKQYGLLEIIKILKINNIYLNKIIFLTYLTRLETRIKEFENTVR